jgi:hypothetical protein
MKFFDQNISRLVIGCNPFYGYCHDTDVLAKVMKDYYTPERVMLSSAPVQQFRHRRL